MTGPDTFCRNPAYEVSTLSSVTSFGSIRTSGVTAWIAPELATRVWRAYLDMPRFETEKLFRLFSEIAALPGRFQFVPFRRRWRPLPRISSSERPRTKDLFAAVEIRSAVIRALLPHLGVRTGAREALKSQVARLLSGIEKSYTEFDQALKNDKYALLSRPGGPADLYYLPLRLAEVLGAIA